MAGIHITDIESAINYWRAKLPSPDGVALPAATRALAEVYALLVYHHETEADEASMPAKAHAAWMDWYASTPDTPLHRHLLHQPGRRGMQGLWPQLPRSPALAANVARREARHLAAHYAGIQRLAL